MQIRSESTHRVVTRFPHVYTPASGKCTAVPEEPALREKRVAPGKHPDLHLSWLYRCMLIALLLLFLNIWFVLDENAFLLGFYARLTVLMQ